MFGASRDHALHAATDEEGRSLIDADDSGARLCSRWGQVFEARVVDDQDHSCETILNYAQRAPENFQWTL